MEETIPVSGIYIKSVYFTRFTLVETGNWTSDCSQKYEGSVYHDSLHGEGRYEWQVSPERLWSFDGSLYANKKHGYGKLRYPDGSQFEGLWLAGRRCGPGVLTHANGRQDAGLWWGRRLVRLTGPPLDEVPRLGASPRHRKRLDHFRRLVPAREDAPDPKEAVLRRAAGGSDVIGSSSRLHSRLVRDPRSLFFDARAHDAAFHGSGVAPQDAEGEGVTLVAWNNSDHVVHMMRHAYLHRHHKQVISSVTTPDKLYLLERCNRRLQHCCECLYLRPSKSMLSKSEAAVGERIVEAALGGGREALGAAGALEAASLELLSCCVQRRTSTLLWLLQLADVHPCVADSRGNCGLLFAAAVDNRAAVDALLDRGACVDQVNDEGVSALALCLLRLLAAAKAVRHWGDAFLSPRPTEDVSTAERWPPCRPGQSHEEEREEDDGLQQYVLGVGSPGQMGLCPSKSELELQSLNEEVVAIRATIAQLLGRGADPNTARVPCPALHLAVHAGSAELVAMLLHSGADANAVSLPSEGGFTALHVASLSPPGADMVEMCRLLLHHGADPLIPMTGDLDPKTSAELLGDRAPSDVQLGRMTTLHALCLRRDCGEDSSEFLEATAELLGRVSGTAELLLGYSPLSLAVFRGSPGMLRGLLAAGHDPNQALGPGLGTSLSILLASRCLDRHPAPILLLLVDLLLDSGADPLVVFSQTDGTLGNVIDFAHRELDSLRNARFKDAASRRLAAERLETHEALVRRVSDRGRSLLVRHVQGRLTRQAIAAFRDQETSHAVWTVLPHWLSVAEMARCLRLLSEVGSMDISQHEVDHVLDYIRAQTAHELVQATSEEEVKDSHQQAHFLIPPEVDECGEKYAACLECVRRAVVLEVCQACSLVLLCVACQATGATRRTPHSCASELYTAAKNDDITTRTSAHEQSQREKMGETENVPRRRPRLQMKPRHGKVKAVEETGEKAKKTTKKVDGGEMVKSDCKQKAKKEPESSWRKNTQKRIFRDRFPQHWDSDGPSHVLWRNGDLYYSLYEVPRFIENYSLN